MMDDVRAIDPESRGRRRQMLRSCQTIFVICRVAGEDYELRTNDERDRSPEFSR
jgi:hypothetical protein